MQLPRHLKVKLLRIILAAGSLKPGPFVRRDGFVVPFYPDFRKMLAQRQFIQLLDDMTKSVLLADIPEIDIVCGIESAGMAIGYAVAHTLKKDFAYIRKEQKSYSLRRQVEGIELTGKRVLLVDDTLFYGETKHRAMQVIKKAGGRLVGIFVIFTLNPQARRWIEKQHVKVWRLLDFDEVWQAAVKAAIISQAAYNLNRDIYQNKNWLRWQKDKQLWQRFKEIQKTDPFFSKNR